jgi:NAD(P)-dependent dehydrogenase (short-subunit alcohol dehydrogenase family)
MKEAKYGKIVNFSSVTGVMVCDPGSSAYAGTKGAVMAFTKALASELASSNITVNAILPGVIDTPMVRKVYEGIEGGVDAALDAAAKAIPMGRIGRPEEVAEVACFLTSDESSYVTGHGLVIDGGSTLPESFV